MESMDPSKMPFDGKRMFWGCLRDQHWARGRQVRRSATRADGAAVHPGYKSTTAFPAVRLIRKDGGNSFCGEVAFLLTIAERDTPMTSTTASRSQILAANLDTIARARRTKRKSRALALDKTLQQLVSRLIAARLGAGSTQAEVAALMATTRSTVSRLESGRYTRPTLSTIEKYAVAVGCQVEVCLRPNR